MSFMYLNAHFVSFWSAGAPLWAPALLLRTPDVEDFQLLSTVTALEFYANFMLKYMSPTSVPPVILVHFHRSLLLYMKASCKFFSLFHY